MREARSKRADVIAGPCAGKNLRSLPADVRDDGSAGLAGAFTCLTDDSLICFVEHFQRIMPAQWQITVVFTEIVLGIHVD